MTGLARRSSATILLALLLGPVASADAQRTIRGVLFDSLRTNAPIAGAEVVLLGTGRRATTDRDGRFEFIAVPAAAAAVAFWAPWLDSLALLPLRAELPAASSADDVRILLATPSRATHQTAVCGVELGAEDGILVGETRGTDGVPRAGVVVTARWTETSISAVGLVERMIATVDTTSASGIFTLCGVPLETVITLRAIGAQTGSGERSVGIRDAVQRHDLTVGGERATMTVRGRVVRPGGVAVTGARVRLSGDTARSARTDSSGTFVLDGVPQRSDELDVRAVGHTPVRLPIDPPAGSDMEVEVTLEPLPPELERVTVTADPFAHERRGFEERRALGLGAFITEEMLRRLPDVSANGIAGFTPRVRSVSAGPGRPVLMLRQGSGICGPRWYIDGVDNGRLDMPAERRAEQWDLLQRAKRIEIYSAAQAPPRFNDNNGCGVVVIWTR